MSGIQMALLGSGGPLVNFNDQYVFAVRTGSAANATYRIDNDGSVYEVVNGTATVLENWVIPASAAGGYEVFATLISGGLTSGTTGSWLATSNDNSWSCTALFAGTSVSATVDFQVRAVGTTTVLDTWSVTLDAERL